MSARFDELDWEETPIGEISLRRRLDPALDVDVYEVKLGDEYLMSSLFTVAEIELADSGLAALRRRRELDVVVGGLGPRLHGPGGPGRPAGRSLLVVEALGEVIDWHSGTCCRAPPSSPRDPRCRLVHGDFFALAAGAAGFDPEPPARFDAILVDIDHSPRHVLHPSHAPLLHRRRAAAARRAPAPRRGLRAVVRRPAGRRLRRRAGRGLRHRGGPRRRVPEPAAPAASPPTPSTSPATRADPQPFGSRTLTRVPPSGESVTSTSPRRAPGRSRGPARGRDRSRRRAARGPASSSRTQRSKHPLAVRRGDARPVVVARRAARPRRRADVRSPARSRRAGGRWRRRLSTARAQAAGSPTHRGRVPPGAGAARRRSSRSPRAGPARPPARASVSRSSTSGAEPVHLGREVGEQGRASTAVGVGAGHVELHPQAAPAASAARARRPRRSARCRASVACSRAEQRVEGARQPGHLVVARGHPGSGAGGPRAARGRLVGAAPQPLHRSQRQPGDPPDDRGRGQQQQRHHHQQHQRAARAAPGAGPPAAPRRRPRPARPRARAAPAAAAATPSVGPLLVGAAPPGAGRPGPAAAAGWRCGVEARTVPVGVEHLGQQQRPRRHRQHPGSWSPRRTSATTVSLSARVWASRSRSWPRAKSSPTATTASDESHRDQHPGREHHPGADACELTASPSGSRRRARSPPRRGRACGAGSRRRPRRRSGRSSGSTSEHLLAAARPCRRRGRARRIR